MKKEISKKNPKKIFKIIVLIYFSLSPIFDFKFFYNHTTTLIRILLLLIFVLITLFLYKDSWKTFKYLIIYFLLMGGFLVVDFIHAQSFNSLVPGNLNYSVVNEAMTLLKLCMPFVVLFVLKYQNLKAKDIFSVINSWSLLVAGVIVLSNICGYSLSSYTDEITRYSIFSWGQGIEMKYIATKGFFTYANQEAIILLLCLVITSYETLFYKGKSIILVLLISLASIMLGTRISTIAGLLTLISVLISYILYNIIFKKKISKMLYLIAIVILGWILIYPISPNETRLIELDRNENLKNEVNLNEESHSKQEEIDKDKNMVSNTNNDVKLLIESKINRSVFGDEFYTKYYPYIYDSEFWINMMNSENIPTNYRDMELAIIKRIDNIDGRWTNKLFGISNSRIQNVVNIERDFILQYYAFGIIGLVITSLFYLYSLYRCLKIVIKERDYGDLMILACLLLFVLASFFSGNSLNFLATIIPLAFIESSLGRLKIA